MERDTIARMKLGQNSVEPIYAAADLRNSREFTDNPKRLEVLEGFLKTTDQVTAMNGAAGSAKSTSIKIIADHAIAQGFTVQGLAPTGPASLALSEKGVRAQTLQLHLVEQQGTKKQQRGGEEFTAKQLPSKVLYLLDEASLTSTRQMNAFLRTLRPQDRASFDTSGHAKTFARILVGGDSGPRRVNPRIAVGVIGVPMRVYQLLDWIGIDG